MSYRERTGVRNLSFSTWHRSLPQRCHVIDIDFCEYCWRCRRPLALIETATGHHDRPKPTTVLQRLAEMAGLPAWLILYDIDLTQPFDIGPTLRVSRLRPDPAGPYERTLEQVGDLITRIHDGCACQQRIAS